MSMSVGKLITGSVVLIIVFTLLIVLLNQYGSSVVANSLSGAVNESNLNFTNQIYNPINQTVNSSSGFKVPLLSSSTTGFSSFAFIFAAIPTVLQAALQAPQIIGQFALIILNISPVQLPINNYFLVIKFISLMELFIIFQFIGAWMKYSLWSTP